MSAFLKILRSLKEGRVDVEVCLVTQIPDLPPQFFYLRGVSTERKSRHRC